jgi:pilus assembly protein CpaE
MTVLYEPLRQQAQHLAMLVGGDIHTAVTLDEVATLINTDRDELLVIFGPGVPLSEAVSFASAQRVVRPALGVVLLRPHLDLGVLSEALRAGVREVADINDPAAVLAACARSQNLSRQIRGGPTRVAEAENGPAPDGRVITVFAAKGGCGKTTLATNLAISLAQGGSRRVCIIDLDLAFGDVAIMLQLVPEKTIADLIPVADRIDETGIRTMLTAYCPGVDAMLAPVQPAIAEEVTRDLVADVIDLTRRMFDYVVIDTPPHFNDVVLAALDASHLYVLVATPDLPALKNLRVTLDMFEMLDYQRDHRVVVLNRADARVGLTGADIERVIRVPIVAHVPSSRDVPISVNKGVPIVLDSPGHPVSTAIRELANGRLAGEVPAPTKGLRGLLGRRSGRR